MISIPCSLPDSHAAKDNATSVELLQLALQIRHAHSWSRPRRLKAPAPQLESLRRNDRLPLDAPDDLEAIGAIMHEEIDHDGIDTVIHHARSLDAASLKEIVAGEIRAGIAGAAEPLPVMMANFPASPVPAEENKKTSSRQRKVRSKYRADVKQRPASFL